MQRRTLIRHLLSAAAAAPAGLLLLSGTGPAAAAARSAPPGAYRALLPSFETCQSALGRCIAHCQRLLAEGEKSVADCLRTALDCDVSCGATLRAASLDSVYTPALARVAVPALEGCIEACKPHVDHHAECKACHDACVAALKAARTLG